MSKYTEDIGKLVRMRNERGLEMFKAQQDYNNMRHSDPEIVRKAEDRYLLAVIAHELMLKR